MFRAIRICVFVSFLAISFSVQAQDISQAFMPQRQQGRGAYLDKKTKETRSEFSSVVERSEGAVYDLVIEGKGDYGKYSTVFWRVDVRMQEKDGLLYTESSKRVIKDEEGNIVITYEKEFDYPNKKVYFVSRNGKGDIVKEKTFPIKGKITDNNSLIYFLKTFIAHRSDKEYSQFYLISSEPKLYRIKIKVIGDEVLNISKGNINTIKVRLIPQFGILTGLTKAIVPPTFVWYTKKSPYFWLQYEGLETGLGSAHIVSGVRSFDLEEKDR